MQTALIRKQLDQTLKMFQSLIDIPIPPKGWIRALRNALSMSGRQLADRLGVSKQRVALIEKEETTGSLSIKTMRKIGEALNCRFVYGFVPRNSLEELVRKKAEEILRQRISRVSQSMSLEDQSLSTAENTAVLKDEIDRLVQNLPRNFWDQK